VEILWWF